MAVCSKKPPVNSNFVHTYGNCVQITEMHSYEVLTLCMSMLEIRLLEWNMEIPI